MVEIACSNGNDVRMPRVAIRKSCCGSATSFCVCDDEYGSDDAADDSLPIY